MLIETEMPVNGDVTLTTDRSILPSRQPAKIHALSYPPCAVTFPAAMSLPSGLARRKSSHGAAATSPTLPVGSSPRPWASGGVTSTKRSAVGMATVWRSTVGVLLRLALRLK